MRGHAEACVGLHVPIRIEISVSEPFRPDQLLVGDHTHDDARQPPDRDLAVQPGREQPDLGLDVGVGGEGLGLGLAICFEVVQQFGGRLDIRSAPGDGTEVAVILPLLARDDTQEAAE